MKTKYLFWILGLIIFVPVSCKKWDMNTEPITQTIKTPTVLNSMAELEKLILGIYKAIADEQEYNILDRIVNGDVLSDNCYAGGDNPQNLAIDVFNLSALNTNFNRDWQKLYTMISKANEVITLANNSIGSLAGNENRINQIIGEAKTIRAFFYFDLVQLWGGVPLIIAPPNASDAESIFQSLTQARKSTDEIYTFIIDELNFASQNVMDIAATTSKEIVTKGVVNALLTKVYAARHDWINTIKYADLVINAGYAMLPNYDNLYRPNVRNTSESIWEVNYGLTVDGNPRNSWVVWMHIGNNWKKFNIPSNDLVALFDNEDGSDKLRKKASIIIQAGGAGWIDDYWDVTQLPRIYKIRDDKTDISTWTDGRSSWFMLRLPDILLLKAEALANTGDISGAMALVNQVRTRNGKRTDINTKTAAGVEEAKTAIAIERRLELAFEGHRWNDLLRTGTALTIMNSVKDGQGQSLNYNVQPNNVLMPIPRIQIDQNKNLIQNLGY